MATSSSYTSLVDLGSVALSHQREIEAIRAELGITHGYFDAWLYGFLENKKFNIEEALEKLKRRFAMEISVLAEYQLTDYARRRLREGIMQDIGNDKQGRAVFYMCASRDSQSKEHAEEDQMIFDMFISYGTRLRQESKCSQMVMLINQQGYSFLKAMDSGLQGDQAIRISKFYPGMVFKMYMCGMSSTAAFMAKPIISRLPAVVSERLQIISEKDIKNGALFEYFDKSVLPLDLGGTNDCDKPSHWHQYADRIENYFMKLKDAVRNSKLTVKEFELEELGIDLSGKENTETPLALSPSTFPLQHTGGTSARNSVSPSINSIPDLAYQRPLLSCRSDYSDDVISTEGGEAGPHPRRHRDILENFVEIFKPLPPPFALFFIEEFIRWVDFTMEHEEVERYKILKERADCLGSLMSHEQRGWSIEVANSNERAKFHIVCFIKFWTLIFTLFTSIYFLLAIIFWAVFSGNMIVALFLGFFVEPSFVFPLSFGIVAVFSQGTSITKRGIEIVMAIWSQRVIPPLGLFGAKGGVISEAVLSLVLAITQLAVFIYYCKYGAALGLQHSIAVAWVVAVCVVLLSHVFFFTGFFNHKTKSSEHSDALRLPLFFIQRGKHQEKQMAIPNVIMVICGLMLMASLLLGVGFLISRIVILYVCTVVVTIASAWLINVCCDELLRSASSIFMSMVTDMFCLSWIYITFLFGFEPFSTRWAIFPIVYAVISAGFFLCGVVGLKITRNTTFLRAMYVFLLLYFFSCWVSTFPLVNWGLGVMIFVFIFHSLLNLFLAPSAFSDSHSSFLVCLAGLLLLTACVLIGWNGMSPTYVTGTLPTRLSVSQENNDFLKDVRPSSALSRNKVLESLTASSLEVYHRYPVCSIQVGTQSSSFSIADMSYLVELSSSIKRQPESVEEDFQAWFEGTSLTYNGVVSSSYNDDLYVLKFSSSEAGTTFYVVKQFSPLISTSFMTVWLSSLSLRPFEFFVPEYWIKTFNLIISVIQRMIPYSSWDIIDYLENFLSKEASASSDNIIVLADGIIGGGLAAAVCRLDTVVQAILFDTPGQLNVVNPASVDSTRYHDRVLSIMLINSVNFFFGGLDISVAQFLPCSSSVETCESSYFITKKLQDACAGL